MQSNAIFKKIVFFTIILCSFATIVKAQYPATPPANVTNTMDRDQMVSQLGIAFPQLPSKLIDVNAPSYTYPSNSASPEDNWTDSAGHTITRGGFGLWNNYDEPVGLLPYGYNGTTSLQPWRAGNDSIYPPINLLKMHDGTVITSRSEWYCKRRPEMFNDIQNQFWGVLPHADSMPGVTFTTSDVIVGSGATAHIQRTITGTIDTSMYPQVRNVPKISATLWLPVNVTGKVPVIIVFGAFSLTQYWSFVQAKGWGLCAYNLTQLQPDNGAGLSSYLIGLVNHGSWRKPSDMGTLVAWAWGAQKLLDYFQTDTSVDATKVGVEGHSRYGKAAAVAMAYDQRIAIGYPSCSGSLGLKLNRRHWGEDAEGSSWDQEYHWMSGNFFKYMGPAVNGQYLPRKIIDCPVDAHSLLAMCAPRPVYTNGGNSDSWSDPYGTFLTEFAATPVYNLLGYNGMEIPNTTIPAIDSAYVGGQLAFRYHTGGHTDVPDWPAFVTFATPYFADDKPVVTTGQTFAIDAAMDNNIDTVMGTDADNQTLRAWTIMAGDCDGIFNLSSNTGFLSVAHPELIDFTKASYILSVTTSDSLMNSKQEDVTIAIADSVKLCLNGHDMLVPKSAAHGYITQGATLGICANPAPVGVNAVFNNNNINIYPNPTTDIVNVELSANTLHVTSIDITSINGAVLESVKVKNKMTIVIRVSKFSSGIYFVTLNGDKKITQKLILTK